MTLGFEGVHAVPCLMVKRNKKGVNYVATWVDDSLLVDDDEVIEETIKGLET